MRAFKSTLAAVVSLFIACAPEHPAPVAGTELGHTTQVLSAASLSLSPSTIAGGSGSYSIATVTLDAPAGAGGAVVAIASSNTDLAASVQSVTVPAGQTSATFRVRRSRCRPARSSAATTSRSPRRWCRHTTPTPS